MSVKAGWGHVNFRAMGVKGEGKEMLFAKSGLATYNRHTLISVALPSAKVLLLSHLWAVQT